MISSKSSFYLSMWAQGAKSSVTIPCLTLAEAQAIRLKMYTVARPYRSLDAKVKKNKAGESVTVPSLGALHPEIHQQVISTEINIEALEDGSAILTIRPDWMNERLMRISAATGIPFGPVAEAAAAMQRIQASLDDLDAPIVIPEGLKQESKRKDYLQVRKDLAEKAANAANLEQEIVQTDKNGNVIDPNYVSPINEDYERELMKNLQQMNEEDPYA